MEKLIFTPDGDQKIELFVIEKTTIGGIDYYLATETEEGDSDALILKDLSKREEEEAVFEVVSDDNELDAVAKVFESILDDVSFVREENDDN